MKKLITMFISVIAVAFLMSPFAFAQTPDGQTPAEETVCDPLKEDGITKGLYGLCVAFCEAQDHADGEDPITEEEFEALIDDAPSGKILANYNKKREKANNGTDPDMPCILIEEPCPCWSADELASVDGIDSNTHLGIDLMCSVRPDGNLQIREGRRRNDTNLALAGYTPDQGGTCLYNNRQTTPIIRRRLGTGAETLTLHQAEACQAEVTEACAAIGF